MDCKKNISTISHTNICSTYNSYVVKGEKTAVINLIPSEDKADAAKFSNADYIVFTGTMPSCAGILEEILNQNKDAVIVGTTATIRNYKEILNHEFCEYAVKNEGELDLGGACLKFYITPNINQPDTMMVYEKESGILFSGKLFSSYDTMDGAEWYYTDNLAMYSEYADKAGDIAALLAPTEIYPYIGEERAAEECTVKYTIEKPQGKTASVYYSSVYGYTKMMAEALAEGLKKGGAEVSLFDAKSDDADDMADGFSADMLLFGTSTLHRNAPQEMWRLISRIDAVSAPKKTAAVFGSYGWSGEGVRIIEKMLKALKVRICGGAQTAVYRPTEQQLDELRSFGEKMAADFDKSDV